MKGDPRIDVLMIPVAKAIKTAMGGKFSSEIYNRAYEAVMHCMEEIDSLRFSISKLNEQSMYWAKRAKELESRIASLEAQTRWVLLIEKMPEEDQYILMWDEHFPNRPPVALQFDGEDFMDFEKDEVVICDSESTHWMPLPEPPELPDVPQS